ncbi:unnamed protein product [Paramecium sonneborni]|uniref:Transmembrane protein n=1 Tax=Paramecium sonneborni TaxID=65129 RepID=A0A8S1PTY8_9CILI|nr:unnamed protein product [Paramecium sonneborni]
MDRLYQYWPLMITLTLIILIVRYTYTIKFFYYLVELYFQQPTLLSDFGLDPDFNTLKLVGTGIALLVLCAYKRAYLVPSIQKEIQYKQIYKKDILSYYFYCIYIKISELLRNAQGQETISWIGIENQYQNKYLYLQIMFHLSEMLQVLNVMFKQQVNDYLQLFLISSKQNKKKNLRIRFSLMNWMIKMKDFLRYKIITKQDQIYNDNHKSIDNLIMFIFYIHNSILLKKFLFFFLYYSSKCFCKQIMYVRQTYKTWQIGQAWGALCILQMLEVIRKYGTLQWTPPSWDVRKSWWYFKYTCDPKGKESFNYDDPNDSTSDFMKCQTDWNYWLSLQGYTNWDLGLNFIALLISLCFYRHFTTIRRRQQEQEINNHFNPNRENIQESIIEKMISLMKIIEKRQSILQNFLSFLFLQICFDNSFIDRYVI